VETGAWSRITIATPRFRCHILQQSVVRRIEERGCVANLWRASAAHVRASLNTSQITGKFTMLVARHDALV
jgi:hypothetical protein